MFYLNEKKIFFYSALKIKLDMTIGGVKIIHISVSTGQFKNIEQTLHGDSAYQNKTVLFGK